jgi:hypothetical protein
MARNQHTDLVFASIRRHEAAIAALRLIDARVDQSGPITPIEDGFVYEFGARVDSKSSATALLSGPPARPT